VSRRPKKAIRIKSGFPEGAIGKAIVLDEIAQELIENPNGFEA